MEVKSVDVARRAGVSRATVSQILNGHADRFAPETRDKVLKAASELDYQPSIVGRALRRGSSDIVIALVPNTTFGSNLQDLYERITTDLSEQGFILVLRMTNADPVVLDRLVASLMPAAVMSLTPFTDAEREVLDNRGVLKVEPPSASSVDRNRAIGELQARELVARGYRRIAFAHLRDARQDPFGQGREEGVRAAAGSLGIDDIDVVRLGVDPVDAGSALDELGQPGIAVACYNDEVAAALLAAARSRGWRVPEDVALIGMDHAAISRVTVPPLTTVGYDLDDAAGGASKVLLAALGVGPAPTIEATGSLRLIPGGTV